VDDYLTFLGSILKKEKFVKEDSFLKNLNKWKAQTKVRNNRAKTPRVSSKKKVKEPFF